MATPFSMQHQLFHHLSLGLDIRKNLTVYALQHAKLNKVECSLNNGLLVGSLSRYYTSLRAWPPLAESIKTTHFSCTDQSDEIEENTDVPSSSTEGVEFNRVDYVVSVLHESARSFSKAVESLGLARCGPELSMAWIGKDVHEWHRRISYQVAVYALMKTAIDLEILLSHERHNEFSPVREILNPLTNQVEEHIELQLRMQHPDLVHWFRDTEMPQIAAYFIPLLKQWSVEYAGSGIAGIIVAITCCTAVVKLGSGRIRRQNPVLCLEEVLVKLMDFSLNLALVDKLHQLAIEAGFELNFLSHFGKKILPSEKTEELEFWIGLAHKKLQKAFSEESVMSNKQSFQHKIPSDSLATLGLFAYLGSKTRIFLSAMGIKDLDEIVKDFLSYLECGILFIYPDFSSIPVYQCFMEVVTDEIGWLDFYASYVQINCKQKRQKHSARQAEKEIILSVVFTVCYDVFSGFAHFNRSTQQSLDTASLSYLLHCQGLLSNCLQDYWAAYDKSGDSLNIMEHAASDNHTSSSSSYIRGINGPKLTLVLEGFPNIDSQNSSGFPKQLHYSSQSPISATNKEPSSKKVSMIDKSNPLHESVIKRCSTKLASTSADLWMGTRLLFMDIKVAFELLAKQAHGFKVSRSQRRRLARTFTDVIVLIPMTILMLLPVTTVGHAAIIAAIKKYMPFLIPSSYSPERLDVVKQLKQTREMMSHQSLENQEDQPPTTS